MSDNETTEMMAAHDTWFEATHPEAWAAYEKGDKNGVRVYEFSMAGWAANATLQAAGANYIPASFAEFDGLSAEELVKEFGRLKALKESNEETGNAISAMYDFLRLTKVPQVFDDRDITMLKVAGVGRCQLTGDIHASIVTGQQEAAFEYLRDTARGDLIKETVAPGTLKSALKLAIKNGEELPDELFRVSPFTRASIVKG